MDYESQKCRLCQQIKPLCRSHIVPEFAYEPIKNDKHQMNAIGLKTKKVQTGHFERLLCAECEALLSGYESEFKKGWIDTIPQDLSHLLRALPNDDIAVKIMNFDRFKMFHLSVFWRAAVSKFKVDQNISLGSHANQLAELIMSGATCPPGDFPFFAVLNVDAVGQPVPTVSPLAKGEVQEDIFDGHDYYMMSYAYCDWTFIVARPGPEWLRILEEQFRRDGIFVLPTTSHKQSKSFALASERLSQQRQQGNSARGIRAGNSTEPDLEFRF